MTARMAARFFVTAAVLLLACGRAGASDRQLRPYVGATFGGSTPFVDLESAAGNVHPAIGIDAMFLGELFGVDIDVADVPGFLESGDLHLVLHSRVTTVCGNVVVAAPRRLTEYSLRPYFVAGGGLMRVRETTSLGVFDVSNVTAAFDLGVGVVAFVTNRAGVSWDVRRFQSVYDADERTGYGDHLSFWRATMAVVIRY
jgi:outer membrane protein with beta-barrel domain